jgi:Uncharacterized conserved protein
LGAEPVTIAPVGGERDWLSQLRRTVTTAWSAIRARPFTFSVVTVVLIAAFVSAIARRASGLSVSGLLGTGVEPLVQQGNWWSPVTAIFATRDLLDLAAVLVLVVVLVGIAEGVMGQWRVAIAFLGTGIAGAVFGILVQVIAGSRGELWAHGVRELIATTGSTAVAGTVMAASAFVGPLWRRRMRLITLFACLLLLLYSGAPADLYRMLAVLVGFGLGYLLRPPARIAGWLRSSHHEVRVLMASVVALTAIGPVVTLLTPSRFGPLAPIALLLGSDVPSVNDVIDRCQVLDVTQSCLRDITLVRINGLGPILLSVLPLVLLLVIAWGLVRGRRFAVWLGVVMFGLLALLAALYFGFLPLSGVRPRQTSGRYWEVAVALSATVLLPAAIAVLLVVLRRHFAVRSSGRAAVAFAGLVALSGAALAGLYVGLGWMLRGTGFSRTLTLNDLLSDVAERFVPISFLHREMFDYFPTTVLGGILYHGVGPVLWVIVIAGAIWAMRSGSAQVPLETAARVREAQRRGGDGLSYLATWPGNSYWFDTLDDGVVAYRVIGGIAITTGGPLGAPEDPTKVMLRFARFCDDRGWVPVFYSVEQESALALADAGWSALTVAEETIIHPPQWSTSGKRWQDVRSSINRAARAGIRAEWLAASELSHAQRAQLIDISEQWVAEKGLPEMGFTLGGIDEVTGDDVRVMLAVDEDDAVHGVTSWLPRYRDGVLIGWTLDFMRRRPRSMNGVMEFLIAETAERLRSDDVEIMSLSGAPLAHTSHDVATDRLERMLGYLSTTLEPAYGFRSLLDFKRKFQPEFRPLVMAYPDSMALPRIGLALVRAYLPGLSARQAARLLRDRDAGAKPAQKAPHADVVA